MKVLKMSLIASLLTLSPLAANATGLWFESKVVEVSTRADAGAEHLYIRTESNPNPASCVSSWNGAQWAATGASMQMALSIALSAKENNQTVRFQLDESACAQPSGNPVMKWIQVR